MFSAPRSSTRTSSIDASFHRGRLVRLCLGASGLAMVAIAGPAHAQYSAAGGTATASGAIAIGQGSQASGAGVIAVGANNTVDNANSAVIGDNNVVVKEGTIANHVLGNDNTVTAGGAGYNSIVGNYNTNASGSSFYNSIVGDGNNFSGGSNNKNAIIGTENYFTAGHSSNNTILGNSNFFSGSEADANNVVGNFNRFSGSSFSTVSGNGNTVSAAASNSSATGNGNTLNAANVGVVGNNNQVDSANAFVLGNGVTVAAGLDGAVVLGSGSTASAPVATSGATINGTAYSFAGSAPASAVSVGAAGAERQITNVAAGQISAGSTDAVNGSQLNATNQAVGQIGAQIAVTNSNVSNLTTNITNGTIGLVQQTGGAPGNGPITIGAMTGGVTIDVSGTSGARVLSGVANGVAPNDAVNVSQLAAAIVSASSGGVVYDDASKTSVTLNAGGQAAALQNVASGNVSATSTDAVNGAQLYTTNQQVTALATGAAGAFQANNTSGLADPVASGVDAVAGGFGAVASGARSTAIGSGAVASGANSIALGYNSSDDGRSNVVSVGSAGAERQIVNVAAGTRATDAVNVAQLSSGLSNTLSQANAYTDSRFAALNYDLRSLRRRADSGTAAAMAIAGLPQAFTPGAGMIAGGFGVYRDQTAFAFGASKAFNDEHTVVKMGGSIDSRGTAGANVGIGYQF